MNRRNVLLITTDQHRFDCIGANGNGVVKTPNIDRLASMGVNFQRHHCSNPTCSPARASILTGLHARTHGLFALGYEMPEEIETLPQILVKNGYRTSLFGKVHLEALESRRAERFDHTKPYYGLEECHVTEDDVIGEYMDWIRAEHSEYTYAALENTCPSFRVKPYSEQPAGKIDEMFESKIPEELHQTAWITNKMLEYFDENKDSDKPFFAWCSYVDPHHPWNPPARFASMYDPMDIELPDLEAVEEILPEYWYSPDMDELEYRRMIAAYYGLISFVDEYIGKLLDYLEKNNMLDNTTIIFTSDHGDYNGDGGLIRKMWRLYEGITHIPLIITTPGQDEERICSGLTQDVDLMQTILDLCNIEIEDTRQGHSLIDVLEGKSTNTRRDYAVTEFTMQNHPFGKNNWNLALVDSDNFKLTYYPFEKKFYMVDLSEDPYERNNLYFSSDHTDRVERLKSMLLNWQLNTNIYMREQRYRW